jgi:hypothetical protein
LSFEQVIGRIDFDGSVTIGLPIRGWPVVSLAILERQTQDTLWLVLNAGLDETGEQVSCEVHVTSLTLRAASSLDSTQQGLTTVPLEYGVAPRDMYQRFPETGSPPRLQRGKEYLIGLREAWEADLRRFVLKIE